MTLDLIIPHYHEPYEVVRPMLDMLRMQRKVEPDSLRILLMHDGEDCRIPELEGQEFPFELREIFLPHRGVSAVRNCGLEMSDADWVMFCDCDDTFASVYSIYEIMSVLDTEDHDMLWCPYYFELPGNYERCLVDKFELTFLHGKLFKRSFLIEHNLRFNENLRYTEDTSFLHVVGMEADPKRIGKIQPNMPLYVYVRREGSVSNNRENLWKNSVGIFHGQVYLAEENLKRGRTDTYATYVVRAMTDAYIALCRNDIDVPREEFDREAWAFYRDRMDVLASVPKETIEKSIVRSVQEFGMKKETLLELPDFGVWLEGWTNKSKSQE